jgi:uncharacterized protein YjaG (DUF416 family)
MDAFRLYLKNQLSTLSLQQKALFAGLTCEKMLPSYILFSQVEKWGDSQVLEQCINLLYSFSVNPEAVTREITEQLQQDFYEVFPDLNDFESREASFAFDTCAAVDYSLLFLLERDNESILDVSTSITDTIDMFIQIRDDLDPNDPHLNAILDADELMQAEINRQKTILSGIDQISQAVIVQLRQFSQDSYYLDLAALP